MDRPGHRAASIGLAAAGLLLLAALSGWRYRASPPGRSLLRVAFSARPERIERCREVSEAELARRLPHMRQKVECVGKPATYRLQVEVDGQLLTERVLRGGGMRRDRPISLLLEHPVAPGQHRLAVRLERIEAADSNVVQVRDSTRRPRQPPLPADLGLVDSPLFTAGRVVLVTYDLEHRRLLLHTRSASP